MDEERQVLLGFGLRPVGLELLLDELRGALDRGERVLDLVGDARGHRADEGEALAPVALLVERDEKHPIEREERDDADGAHDQERPPLLGENLGEEDVDEDGRGGEQQVHDERPHRRLLLEELVA